MSRAQEQRFADIQAAIERCRRYRPFLDSPEMGAMAYDAVLRNLAVIGEAVKSLADDFKASHDEIPWASIAGLRNVVVHEYFRVNPDLIVDILDNHLPLLEVAMATRSGPTG
ncbi:HepT-like ribonuclease domain-containing protein [Knoellia subterranea]|uniref:Toxin-antitoxin system antitoxin subunit n=1 Tax=Knoellia subterranea KCTC 19937 TaxID=1385521 RepID=A0A0A0JNI4_9MICO|nr:HepT-like ribonuclease domain-containing protein [Knoellia subterranea]KGN37186.1 toxin-antitoxin system antitoxin subunit [Knoellia subterranea KCTC 19937]